MKSNVSQIDNPREPDWMKSQSLREIEVIRESKKRDIVSRVLGVDNEET